ncbi:hypothetical protein BU111_12085 [Staphylococcus xylosus]|uniref:Uncharacterized protein n=1 Tax=Staphylococcus xylosus TaxID=1288 RepID=A0AAQ0LZR9_STAXY|nr:hypothetical protein [Staphylococcus xylosus]MCQ3818651.1 hypothetical protein [Staphylococcus xylosus]PTH98809.1 hypothetical protein BU099_07200 [Staphylococcus xylosus]PTI49265.1 hypothetical protein BU111_12085 [Staphylococcus xylosus]PTI53942.1 hypothetical protein BU106_06435 [Staphylococcus xylosus]
MIVPDPKFMLTQFAECNYLLLVIPLEKAGMLEVYTCIYRNNKIKPKRLINTKEIKIMNVTRDFEFTFVL